MWCMLLAAGYATRLRPYTDTMPKALLEVAGKPILDYVVEKVEAVPSIEGVYLVSNHCYADHFQQWMDRYAGRLKFVLLDDGSMSNSDRLGAIGDIQFTLDKMGPQKELLIMGSDNIFDFDLNGMVDFFHRVQADCISAHAIDSLYDLQHSGVVELDEDGRVLSFVEKPENPPSNWAVPPFYLYRQQTLEDIATYLAQGNNPDAPGHLIPWLLQRKPVYAYTFEGLRYDIGTPENYRLICQIMEERNKR